MTSRLAISVVSAGVLFSGFVTTTALDRMLYGFDGETPCESEGCIGETLYHINAPPGWGFVTAETILVDQTGQCLCDQPEPEGPEQGGVEEGRPSCIRTDAHLDCHYKVDFQVTCAQGTPPGDCPYVMDSATGDCVSTAPPSPAGAILEVTTCNTSQVDSTDLAYYASSPCDDLSVIREGDHIVIDCPSCESFQEVVGAGCQILH